MSRLKYIHSVPVEEIPPGPNMEQGILYVSRKHGAAIHLCACGCGTETVTPLKPEWPWAWSLSDDAEGPTLSPSIGNMALPCRSHYWIRDGLVIWL